MEEKGNTTEERRRHCAEVEELMEGKMPFVTRHGVTLVVAAIALVLALLLMMDGEAAALVREMAGHIMRQVSARTGIPGGV